MICPVCGDRLYVTNSRENDTGDITIRRRICKLCGYRATTREALPNQEMKGVKPLDADTQGKT